MPSPVFEVGIERNVDEEVAGEDDGHFEWFLANFVGWQAELLKENCRIEAMKNVPGGI
jgi:hypothetical protein